MVSLMTQLPANDMDGFGRLVAWLAQAALGDTGKRSDGTLDNNLGALSFAEVFAGFCDRLNEIKSAGGQLQLVQIYTVARRPTESYVAQLTDAVVDAIVALVQARTNLPALPFYGNSAY